MPIDLEKFEQDQPKPKETTQARAILFAKYADSDTETKKLVWESTIQKRKNDSRFKDLSDQAFLAHLGPRFIDTFKPKETKSAEDKKTGESAEANSLPEKPENHKTGTAFLAEIESMPSHNSKETQAEIERKILAEIEAGNIPSFCRPKNFRTVSMSAADGSVVQFQTSADYLAIGTDENFVRVPITPLLAAELRKKYGWNMPTATMTDTIYDQADLRLRGIGLVSTDDDKAQMQGAEFIERHNQKINGQLTPEQRKQLAQGQILVAGHKKDIIISRYAIEHPGRLDFRGLYTRPGIPVQQNPAHEDTYRDYSHGYRIISENVTVVEPDGSTRTLSYEKALRDPKLARVLNGKEGQINARLAYSRPTSRFS